MSRIRLGALILVAAAVLLAGCGSDSKKSSGGSSSSTGSQPSASAGGGQTVNVSETEFKLTPANPSVAKAGKITFTATNKGTTTHALEIEAPSGEVKSGAIQPGKSKTVSATLKAGTYQWYCPIDNHKGMGMKGQIKVAGGGSGASQKQDTSTSDSGSGGNGSGY